MPGITGTELAARVREMLPNIIVLIISGYAELEGITSGVARLTKPFRESDLTQMLEDLAGEHTG
jgi:YesN/AraC family two-component response regulator